EMFDDDLQPYEGEVFDWSLFLLRALMTADFQSLWSALGNNHQRYVASTLSSNSESFSSISREQVLLLSLLESFDESDNIFTHVYRPLLEAMQELWQLISSPRFGVVRFFGN